MTFGFDTTQDIRSDAVSRASDDVRAAFLKRTYFHLAVAVWAFAALEAALLQVPGIENLIGRMIGGRFSWLLVIGAFVGVSFLANKWAMSTTSKGKQYAGLGIFVVAEAIIFLPLIWIADRFVPGAIPVAAVSTLVLFSALTAIVFVTGKDFSFLRGALSLGFLLAMGLIVASIIFGFDLGIFFIIAMIALMAGWVLYDTSNVLHHYRTDQHVAASLSLFASIALMFYYILMLVMSLTSRD
ncbi:MAG: Bax inhibitor-1 family protein [Planctomycetota bacterium]